MREVDFWSHLILASGLLVMLAGGLVAGMGILFVMAIAALILWAAGTGVSLGGVVAILSSSVSCAIPGFLLSTPGMLLVGAILWGRLRSRWSHLKWRELRDEDVEEERRRLAALDAELAADPRAEAQRRREALATLSRTHEPGG